jgi:cytochrome c oxidase subunit II
MTARRRTMAVVICLGALALTSITGCTSTPAGGSNSVTPNGNNGSMNRGGPGGGQGGGMMGGTSGANSYSSIGEQIYLAGTGSDGREISHTAPRVSQGALMMGGGGCASCHAANGQGGTIQMMTGTAIRAPNITYSSLIKNGFTDATIQKAITTGLDEEGKPLDVAMPRWHMSNADLDATIAYLKVLSTK